MKSIVFGLSLVGAVIAQVASDAGSSPVAPTPSPTAYDAAMYAGVFVPPAAPTATPAPSDFYQVMPYSAYQSGGYKSLECGYGYSKQYDGSCIRDSWVRLF